MDRMEILTKAIRLAKEQVDDNSALADEGLSAMRKESLTDEQIVAKLAGEFLSEASENYDEFEYNE